ncbi:PREDICTED: probable pectate lyase [Prunus dulcis]|uniref:PREDICTED: probable pectate lyase n=1 Tax=Prunus dulcis TaxID=3755 RepID=A0A5E4E8E1_PRUDU|nr:PREDICTED: probable pectate lyase [Prunus dulcis]
MLREVEPDLMDALIQATKDSDESKLQALSGPETLSIDDNEEQEEAEETDYEEEEEGSHIDVATRWFDSLINKDVQGETEVKFCTDEITVVWKLNKEIWFLSVNTSREMDHHEEESRAGGEPHGKQDDEECNPNWPNNRQSLADCAIGFGQYALGGKGGEYYIVRDSSNDDAVNPRPGTLSYAVIQTEPLWIVFPGNMLIKLSQELIFNSYKTLDGRGANVHIVGGGCITLQFISNVIIHNVHIHNCYPSGT